jgi:hypothetical protein
MARINVIVDNDLYLKIIKIKSELQKLEEGKQNPKNITFTDAVRHVLNKGLSH